MCDYIARRKCTKEQILGLQCITADREWVDRNWAEERKFSLIHNIILGMATKSLEVELNENPHAVHAGDSKGRTALAWATARAQLDDMKLLIASGSDVDTMDVDGRSAVLHAVDSHNVEALYILLDAGANPNPRVPEHLCRSSPLTAASFGGLAQMIRLLITFGAEIDAYNPEGNTALHAAAITQNVECAAILLELGASLDDVSGMGRTAVVTASIHGSTSVLKLFVDHASRTSASVSGS